VQWRAPVRDVLPHRPHRGLAGLADFAMKAAAPAGWKTLADPGGPGLK